MYPCNNEKFPFTNGQDAYVKSACIFCNEDSYCPFKIKSDKSVARYASGDTFDFSLEVLNKFEQMGITPDNILRLKGIVYHIPDGSENDKYKVFDIIIYDYYAYEFDGRDWNKVLNKTNPVEESITV